MVSYIHSVLKFCFFVSFLREIFLLIFTHISNFLLLFLHRWFLVVSLWPLSLIQSLLLQWQTFTATIWVFNIFFPFFRPSAPTDSTSTQDKVKTAFLVCWTTLWQNSNCWPKSQFWIKIWSFSCLFAFSAICLHFRTSWTKNRILSQCVLY